MKKMNRRNFLKVAGVSATAAGLAACGGDTSTAASSSSIVASVAEDGKEMVGNIYVEGLPIAKEPVSYLIMNTKGASDKSASQNDKEIVKLSTADTNISLEWTETSEAAFPDSFKLMIATGDGLPDAFLTTIPSDTEIAENLHQFAGFTDEELAKYAPNIYKALTENVDGVLDLIRRDDGKIYGFPTAVWSEYANWPNAVPFIRKDWLDELGLDIPKTTEEFYNALVAFKDNMKGDDGSAITPLIFAQNNWSAKLQVYAGSWGIAGRTLNPQDYMGRVIDGQYKLMVTDQSFRDFLTEMNRWHSAGLINIDGFSMENAEYQTLQNSRNFGVYSTWTPPVAEWEEGKWAALPVLEAPGYEGKGVKSGEYGYLTANKSAFLITSACKDPIGLLRWWDNCHSSAEWKRIGRDGPVGMAWEYGEDGTTAYVKAVDPLPPECANDTEYHNTYAWRALCPILFGDESAKPNPEKTSEDSIRYEITPLYEDYFCEQLIPNTPVPVDAAGDFAFTKTEIETALENYFAQAVSNGVTDDNWNAFVSEIESLGEEQWNKYFQCYYDNDWSTWG